jgi:hypothetical protein
MANDTPAIPEFNRRTLLRGGLVAGAGAAVAGLATVGLTGVAEAMTRPAGRPVKTAALSFQTQFYWAYCWNCECLWYTGNNTAGVCAYAVGYLGEPHGGHIMSPSFSYELRYNVTGSGGPSYQAGWDWCSACQCLFYSSVENLSDNYCAAAFNGPHKFSGFAYSVLYNDVVTGSSQGNWWWCNQCQALFSDSTGVGGWCPNPTGGQHTAFTENEKLNSLHYDVSYYSTSSP